MPAADTPFFFDVAGAQLLGVATMTAPSASVGVVVVVGGPQYRVGSHRQFVHLSRALAKRGVASLRFDYRGMGDSDGELAGFEDVASDIRGAIDAFLRRAPGVERVVLWGLCDGATASAFYGSSDDRVAGLALYNPWVRTVAGEAKTMLTRYYLRRFADPSFWRKAFKGGVRWREAIGDVSVRINAVRGPTRMPGAAERSLPERFAAGLEGFDRPVLIALSGNDFVATEFKAQGAASGALGRALARPNVDVVEFATADHTFSDAATLERGIAATVDWLHAQFGTAAGAFRTMEAS